MNPAKPSPPAFRTSSLEFDRTIGILLRIGVAASVLLVALGTFWHLANTGGPEPGYSLAGTNLFGFLSRTLDQWASGGLRPRLLVNSGLVVLLLTPYLRVLASVGYFAFVEKNPKYACFTAFVLAALTYSLFLR